MKLNSNLEQKEDVKATYKMIMVDGRCYFNDGNKYVIVDTGYGVSTSIDGSIGNFNAFVHNTKELQEFNPTMMPNGQKIGGILYPPGGFSVMLTRDEVTIWDDLKELPKHKWFLPFLSEHFPIIECKIDGIYKILCFDSGMRLPVLDDDELFAGKEMEHKQLEWIPFKGLAEVPVYKAKFKFPCGFQYDGHMEHDYLHRYISYIFRSSTFIKGYIGLEFFNDHDILISCVKGKKGIAILN